MPTVWQQHVNMDIHALCLCLCRNVLVSFMGVFCVVAYEPHWHRRLFLIVGPVDAGEKWMCSVCVQGCCYLASSRFAVSEKFWILAHSSSSRFLSKKIFKWNSLEKSSEPMKTYTYIYITLNPPLLCTAC